MNLTTTFGREVKKFSCAAEAKVALEADGLGAVTFLTTGKVSVNSVYGSGEFTRAEWAKNMTEEEYAAARRAVFGDGA